MWVLTKTVNDYNQHGDYFVAAWPDKPSPTDLIIAGAEPRDVIPLLDNGKDNGRDETLYLSEHAEPTGVWDMIKDLETIAKAFGVTATHREVKRDKKKVRVVEISGYVNGEQFEREIIVTDYYPIVLDDLVDELQEIYFKERNDDAEEDAEG